MQKRASEVVGDFLTELLGKELKPWRKQGSGSVHLRKDGRWEGRCVIGYDDKGLPKTKNVLAKTKSECVQKLKELSVSIGKPEPASTKLGMTLGQWLDYWYQSCKKPNLQPNT